MVLGLNFPFDRIQTPPRSRRSPRDAEAERRHQEALRSIIDEATDKIINIHSPTPFLQSDTTQSAISADDGASNDTEQNGTATWRAENRLEGSSHTMRTISRSKDRAILDGNQSPSKQGTYRSYHTANGGSDSEDGTDIEEPSNGKRRALKDVEWNMDASTQTNTPHIVETNPVEDETASLH